jgi:thiol-disulfide isomerase/thioredoxin
MKQFILICLAIYGLSCSSLRHLRSTPVTTKSGSVILLGKIPVTALHQPPYAEWYKKGYAAYQPSAAVTDSLRPMANDYTYEIFLGTWCGDSKREVPRLMKLLDQLKVKPGRITIIAVGNRDTLYKQSPTHEEQGKSITRVPHLNMYKNGTETGRITEVPVTSWERDMLSILTGKPYTPVYPKK